MSFTFNATIKSYLLPGDGDEAQQEFLTALNSPYATYIVAYNFSLNSMIEEILAAHANGVPIHIYLDHTQSTGPSEKGQVAKLISAGIDVTVGTSPAGSAFICHTKGLTVLDGNPDGPFCWEGSVNFSKSGFSQVNTVQVFRSKEWSEHFTGQFALLKSFAWMHEVAFQLYPAPVTISDVPVATITESVAVKETTTTITETIAPGEAPGKEQS